MNEPGSDPVLAGLAAGDERAYEALYDRFGGRLYRAALGILGGSQDAEDTVQDVFLSLFRSRRRLVEVKDLEAYLFSALRRSALRLAATREREAARATMHSSLQSGLDGAAHPRPEDAVDPRQELIEKALRSLPREQREVIALKTAGGLTFARIGEVLGVSLHTAASRYRYALEKLRDKLREERHG